MATWLVETLRSRQLGAVVTVLAVIAVVVAQMRALDGHRRWGPVSITASALAVASLALVTYRFVALA